MIVVAIVQFLQLTGGKTVAQRMNETPKEVVERNVALRCICFFATWSLFALVASRAIHILVLYLAFVASMLTTSLVERKKLKHAGFKSYQFRYVGTVAWVVRVMLIASLVGVGFAVLLIPFIEL